MFFHHFVPLILKRKVKVDDSTRGSFKSVKFTGFCGTTSYLFIIVLFIYIHIKNNTGCSVWCVECTTLPLSRTLLCSAVCRLRRPHLSTSNEILPCLFASNCCCVKNANVPHLIMSLANDFVVLGLCSINQSD